MRFVATDISGAFILEPEPIVDERGLFARTWCEREFAEHGISMTIRQCSISVNRYRGTMRGMHYQDPPYAEQRVVRCTSGAIYDVIVDLRPSSRSFRRWVSVEMSQENRRMVYVPEGCAHGFVTLVDDVEVFYQMSALFSVEHTRGVRWNDPAFAIEWPIEVTMISDRDRNHPDFRV